ncbi:ObirOr5-P2 [Ooceraea biroi]|uniref:Odorant receptor n=1 Tax=Ooceraea biroi TaxID=2015173 RepID=A0A3L8DZH1_OOCBI|nr:ObirOr5-P2 [Ooceraea biroi]
MARWKDGKRWKDDIAYAMTPFKLITWPIGVWPLQVYDVYSLIQCSLLVILPCIELCMGCTDTDRNIDCLMLICCGILGMQKTIWFRIYGNNLANNYNSAIKDYVTIENAKQRSIMRRHAFMARLLCCFLVSFSYCSCIIYALIPLLGDNKNNQINKTSDDSVLEYPMPSRCALEFFEVPTSMYRIFCLIEAIALVMTSTCNHGNDTMFLNITLHICGQVEILKTHFINLNLSNPNFNDHLNTLIQRHHHLIKMAKKLAETISSILLTQLFISSVLICIMGFQFILALKVHNVVMMEKSVIVQSTFLTQLSLYSFIGDYLKSQMEEVGPSIYQSSWYRFPAEMMKNLVFIIMRTETPVMFQAGNFIVINLSTYMGILKTSVSYLSVLRVMVEI